MTEQEPSEQAKPRALDGVRVFELGIAIASPSCGRYLAYHGAEVFKVESPTNPDVVRLLGSAWLREDTERAAAWEDSSPYVPEMNADKKSVAVDLKTDGGLDAATRLVAQCDVFIANYTARSLADFGLDYAGVAAINPNIVYVQLPGFGVDPDMPYYSFVAWGPNQAPLVGLDEMTGHAGREPAGIATVAPPDYLSALHGMNFVLAGLEQRDQTGQGVHVDVSQFEATIGLLGPFVMEHDLTGVSQSRIGNRSLWHAPEGVYPSCVDERWIALSVDSDEAWDAFCAVVDETEGLGADERFATAAGRLTMIDELDDALAAITARYDNADLAARLQDAGVTAHIVATNEDLLQDEHIKRSGYYQIRPGTRFKRDLFSGNPIRLSDHPGDNVGAGPRLGEHTAEVLTDVAGLDAAAVEQLMANKEAFDVTEPDLVVERPWDPWAHILFGEVADARDL